MLQRGKEDIMGVYSSISPAEISHPYIGPLSGQKIYSFEGLCYYMQQNWFEAIACIESEHLGKFLRNQLKLGHIADQLQTMETQSSYLDKFNTLFQYCPLIVIDKAFVESINSWENTSEIDRLKSLGDGYYENKQLTKALVYYREALALSESNYKILNNIGLVYFGLRDYALAERYYLKAIKEVSKEEIVLNLIQLYKQQGRYDAAYELVYSIEEVHKSALLLYEAGEINLKRREFGQALMTFLRSYAIDPRLETYIKVIETRIESKDLKQALEDTKKIKHNDYITYGLLKARIYEKNSDLDKAIEVLENILSKGEEDVRLYKELVRLYRLDRQIIKAIQSISWLVEHSAVDIGVRYEMALIAKEAGRFGEFYEKVDELIRVIRQDARFRLSY